MDLSAEDAFRLNVLLANKPLAIRIDEAHMVVYGLTQQGEAKVVLNPQGRDEPYLKKVREMLSSHLTGSPGGYPVFLKRWTRMGQMRDESLEQLLLLGEPEAVMAAVCSPGITDELARRAWWAVQDAENARRMLQCPAVVQGEMGPVLAHYLVEFLPFETETEKMMESVRQVLQAGLLDGPVRLALWKKSARKQAYQVGFLLAQPDHIPAPAEPHERVDALRGALAPELASKNPYAEQLIRLYGAPGQAFLHTVQGVLAKPPTQDVVTAALESIAAYLRPLRPEGPPDLTLDELFQEAERLTNSKARSPVRSCLSLAVDTKPALYAMQVLSGLSYGVVRPVFCDSTAIGSLMRRKLQPILQPLMETIAKLQDR